MPKPRESRHLVPFEVLAVLAIAVVPLPEPVPAALPLLVVASLSLWLRGRSWADVIGGPVRGSTAAAVGALAGGLALGFALLAGAPAIELLGPRAVEWSAHPIVRGNLSLLALVAVYVAATAVATELALRGWIVERVLELSPGPPVLPVLVGAFAEALLAPGDGPARIGAALFGIGLGWMYAAGGRSIVAPLCARLAFEVGAVLLEGLRVIG
ncbi:MAG TPA: CPBP family glutamic-type intramembrane protease [Kofleriaceae bacterium]|nr:CPBP family glutamic-type intramembrane protease [Kofleriaceae bacterium]